MTNVFTAGAHKTRFTNYKRAFDVHHYHHDFKPKTTC